MSKFNEKDEPVNLPSGDFNPAEFIGSSFKCMAWRRDNEYEIHIILRSKVELFLLTTLLGDRIKEWLPGLRKEKAYCIKRKEFSLNLEKIANNPALVCRTARLPIYNLNDPYFELEAALQDEFFETRHFFVRLFSVFNPIPKWAATTPQTETVVPEKILEETDRQSTEHLAYHFGISLDITEDVSLAQTSWAPSVVNMTFEKESDEIFIPFLVQGDVLAYSVIIKKIHGRTVFLPVSFYIHTGDPTEILLYTMPHGNYPIYNANLIHRYHTASIFLTDILDIVLFNPSSNSAIFSSFYGGIDALKKTDFSLLYSRDVYWLLLDKPGADPLEKYWIAIKVYLQLHEHGVNFKVVKFANHIWNDAAKLNNDLLEGNYDGISIMTVKEFLADSESCGVHIPEPLQESDYGLMTGGELENKKDEPFIINPILRRKSLMIFFANTGIGKSWAALSIALGMVHGKDVFNGKWISDGEKHKVFYASGEMRDGEIGERIKRLHEIYADNEADKDNFILKLGTYHNLVSPDDQEEFSKAINYATEHEGTPGLKVTLLIIDNLSALTMNGELSGNWGKLYRWICKLQAQGIAVIIIHHTNRLGDIRGTSQISDKVDMKIHAIQAGTSDNVGLLLKAEKIRSRRKSDLKPFKAEIDLSAPNTGWIVTELSDTEVEKVCGKLQRGKKGKSEKMKRTVPESKAWKAMSKAERIAAIREAWERGDSGNQIAFNYNTSESTISKFRETHNLRRSDLESDSGEMQATE